MMAQDTTPSDRPGARALEGLLAALGETAARPLERARGLPPAAYRVPALLELERERLFARDWHSPGLAAEIPAPGDFMTFVIGDQPVFVVRGRDGQVRGFANVCRHRMMRLLEGRGHCARVVCPYHAWTYGLDGRLITAPHIEGSQAFAEGDHDLPAVRTEIWQGWIYVTLNDQAESIGARLAGLVPLVAPYGMADYRPVIKETYHWRTNWKILTENFMESYHLPVAHRATVGDGFPIDQTGFPDQVHQAFTYQTFAKPEGARYGLAHRDNRRLTGHWRHTTVMPTVYPAHMFVLAPDHLWYLSLRPEAVDRVEVHFGVALAPEVAADPATDGSEIAALGAFFDQVNEEDRVVVEAIYDNAAAPLSRPGPLSWLERGIHDFSGYLARGLGA